MPSLDWRALVDDVLKEAKQKGSEDEENARTEKAAGLERAFRSRLSVITGRAGTGKTTVARARSLRYQDVDGKQSVLLLAPTGKARIRLQETTRREAKTIHQFLAELKWLRFPSFAFKRAGGETASAHTVLIDEASMIPTDLLATLFRALDFNGVRRLVLMGDPNQLPPIGPGRPFADLIRWLEDDAIRADRVVRLRYADASAMLKVSDFSFRTASPQVSRRLATTRFSLGSHDQTCREVT